MPDKKLKKLEDILKLLNENLTREDFERAFKIVLEIVTKIKEHTEKSIATLEKSYQGLLGKAETEKSAAISEIKSEAKMKMAELLKMCEEKLKNLNLRFDSIKESIIMEALSKVVFPEHKETEFKAEEIRQKLESLTGDERLDKSAIKGIDELIEELRKEIGKGKVFGGGFSKSAMDQHFVDNETPTGTVNGVNTDFVAVLTPSPASSLKVFVNGQKMKLTTDYTFAASTRTISFVTAPPTGSIILLDYRI